MNWEIYPEDFESFKNHIEYAILPVLNDLTREQRNVVRNKLKFSPDIDAFDARFDLINETFKLGLDKEDLLKDFEKRKIQDNNNLEENRRFMENILLFEKAETKFQDLNQGIFKDTWYFGKTICFSDGSQRDSLITSDRRAYVNKQLVTRRGTHGENEIVKEFGLFYKNNLLQGRNFWSNRSIRTYLKGMGNPPPKESLFYFIRNNIILKYMDLFDERQADLVACWIIGTYCYELFQTYGYLYFYAFKGSGKTKFMDIVTNLGFNGEKASNITESAFFRTIESGKGTLCFDEYEKERNNNSDRQQMINQILNTGYKKGGCVKRTDKVDGRQIVQSFDVYSPKCIANVSDLHHVTKTRCIIIKMMKTSGSKGRLEVNENDRVWQNTRDELYTYMMHHWEGIKESYDNYNSKQFNNRELEILKGVLSIAKYINPSVEKDITEYIVSNQEDEISEGDSLTDKLFKVLVTEIDAPGQWLSLKYITENINATFPVEPEGRYEGRSKVASTSVGRILAKMPLFRRRKTKSVEYYLNIYLIFETMKRLNKLDIFLQIENFEKKLVELGRIYFEFFISDLQLDFTDLQPDFTDLQSKIADLRLPYAKKVRYFCDIFKKNNSGELVLNYDKYGKDIYTKEYIINHVMVDVATFKFPKTLIQGVYTPQKQGKQGFKVRRSVNSTSQTSILEHNDAHFLRSKNHPETPPSESDTSFTIKKTW